MKAKQNSICRVIFPLSFWLSFLRIITFFISILYLPGAARAQPSPQEIAAKADAYFELQTKLGRFSGAVLIGRNGQVILAKGYGMANYELQVPNTTRTKFRLGSLTKVFTAAAILQLAEKGHLHLEDPISRFFPDYPSADKITIHHLLSHTSGIPDFTELPEYPRFKLNPATLSQTIALFQKLPLQFEPGSKFAYSNSGYILLTAIIEKVSGRRYADYLREDIFLPLNMLDTVYDDPNLIIRHRARGYSERDGRIINAPYIDMTVPSGAGGLLSTVEDLFAWHEALAGDRILSRESREKMFTPYLKNYGYGWEIVKVENRLCARNSGGIEGFSSHITRFLDEDLCYLILSNFDFAPLSQMKDDLAALLLGRPLEWPRERKAIALSPEIFDRYSGDYEFGPDLILRLTRRETASLPKRWARENSKSCPQQKLSFLPVSSRLRSRSFLPPQEEPWN